MGKRVAVVIVFFAVTLGSLTFAGIYFGPKSTDRDRTSDWPTFYREEVSSFFWIPENADIRMARDQQLLFMGSRFVVRFTVPGTEAAEDTLRRIATRSGLEKFRQTDHLYDASHSVNGLPNRIPGSITDEYFVRYLPETGLFEAVWGWD